ncbi:MAG: cell division topological specificity factor MinE [Clostridia bacterium]|nr:cell division topological specificity factor MinE [Clostridia bacterium]
MFEAIANFFKKLKKSEKQENTNSKNTAKERLHLVLMQDRANVSADFLELMKQEIIEVIKKYIEVEEEAIDVRLTNKVQDDGTTGSPFLYANIPILNIRNDMKKDNVDVKPDVNKEDKKVSNKQEKAKIEVEEKKEDIKKEQKIEEEKKEEKNKDKKEKTENNNTEENKEKDEKKVQEVENKKDEAEDKDKKE